MRDLVLKGPPAGEAVEAKRYGYYRRDGKLVRDDWVIAFDKPGAVGPFTMTRTVTYGPWSYPEHDSRRDQ